MRNTFFTDESVKINWFNSEKYFFTDESVKRRITDLISENLTDSDLESNQIIFYILYLYIFYIILVKQFTKVNHNLMLI